MTDKNSKPKNCCCLIYTPPFTCLFNKCLWKSHLVVSPPSLLYSFRLPLHPLSLHSYTAALQASLTWLTLSAFIRCAAGALVLIYFFYNIFSCQILNAQQLRRHSISQSIIAIRLLLLKKIHSSSTDKHNNNWKLCPISVILTCFSLRSLPHCMGVLNSVA